MTHWVEIAGWTLLHFVWQGAVIAVVAAIGLRVLRPGVPHVRYALASAAMATMLVAPVATAMRLSSTAPAADPAPVTSTTSFAPLLSSDAVAGVAVASVARRIPKAVPGLNDILPAIVTLWLAGVALLQLRLLAGWWRVRGVHRASLAGPWATWQVRADVLASRLGLRQLVRVVEAHAVDIPSVIGWWRPVILLPVGALAGLTPAQADAILVHELAHIRRHDYLVNGLQHVAETLLFYHPAVWWVSRRMRIEREHCCDALVVHVCGDPVEYAVALVELEAGRGTRPAMGIAATDGSLLQRIRVLLSAQPSHRRPLADAMVTAFVVAVLVVVTGGGYRWPAHATRANLEAAARVQNGVAAADAVVVVTVNGEAITDGDLQRRQEAATRDRTRPDASLPATLASAIDERLAVQRGKQLGYAMSDEQFGSVLRNLMAQNGLATDAALDDALAKERMTLADLRRNLESSLIVSRLEMSMQPTPVTQDEARQYFDAHLDAFPLQTFEMARSRIEELLADAHRAHVWRRYLETLRSEAVISWRRPDLQRVYESFRAQNPPQGRAEAPQPAPAAQRAPDWQIYPTEHFDIYFMAALNNELPRVAREAERAYRKLSADLRHDLSMRPSLVLFATDFERARASGGYVPGTSSRLLLAVDRPDDRFLADVTHEMTHQFEFDILPAAVLNDSPAWISEGLAEHEGEAWAIGDEDLLRGLVRTDSVPALSAFERPPQRRLSYSLGHAAFDFIAARWGLDGIRRLLFTMRQRQAADRGGLYLAAFDIPAEEFDQAFERYLRERFPSASFNPPDATHARSIAGGVEVDCLSRRRPCSGVGS